MAGLNVAFFRNDTHKNKGPGAGVAILVLDACRDKSEGSFPYRIISSVYMHRPGVADHPVYMGPGVAVPWGAAPRFQREHPHDIALPPLPRGDGDLFITPARPSV